MRRSLQEALIYLAVAVSALFFMAYAVHMLVGGLVSEATEYSLMGGVCTVAGIVMVAMAWDVVRRRSSGGKERR